MQTLSTLHYLQVSLSKASVDAFVVSASIVYKRLLKMQRWSPSPTVQEVITQQKATPPIANWLQQFVLIFLSSQKRVLACPSSMSMQFHFLQCGGFVRCMHTECMPEWSFHSVLLDNSSTGSSVGISVTSFQRHRPQSTLNFRETEIPIWMLPMHHRTAF